jgi:hypothetical protein
MPREWMDHLKGNFETPFGRMEFVLVRGNAVSITAGSQSDKLDPIIIRNIPYYTSMGLQRQPDGTWIKRPDSSDPYMSRRDTFWDNATAFVKNKAYEGIRAAWEEFIKGDDMALIEADRAYLNNEIISVDKDVENARIALENEEAKRQALLKAEAEVNYARGEVIKRGGYPNPRDWSPRGEIPGEEES